MRHKIWGVPREFLKSLFLSFAFSDRNHQVVKVHSGKLNVQGFVDPDASINQYAKQSVDSAVILAARLEAEYLR